MSTVIKKEKKNLLKFYFKIEVTILPLKIHLMTKLYVKYTKRNVFRKNQQATIFLLGYKHFHIHTLHIYEA